MPGPVAILLLTFLALPAQMDSATQAPVAIVGGTVLDLSGAGKSRADIHDAVVLIEGDRESLIDGSAVTGPH